MHARTTKVEHGAPSHLINLRKEVDGRGEGEKGKKRGQHSDTLFDKLQDASLRR